MKIPPFPLIAGLAALAFAPLTGCASDPAPAKHTFEIKGADFVLDGKPVVLRSGEIHYPRTPHQYWRDRLKKAKAMGLNAVCTYVFWNVHEPKRGRWNFEGDADVAEFCRIAQEEGLLVILRPGPYVCAEWDFGGFPAWLLADRTTRVRTNDPKFLTPAREYFLKLGAQLKDLQVTRGGPIIMVQVENEYGSFGDDAEYKRAHVDFLKEAGFEVPYFTSDGPGARGGLIPGIPATINFGGGAESAFATHQKIRPDGPRMNAEFWVGWFDAWGRQHSVTSPEAKAKDYAWMIDNDISVNLYMFHGGTNFGFMAGANGNRKSDYAVDITSYDYSAVLDESGNPTRKFDLLREVLRKKFPAEKFPELPPRRPMQALPAITLDAYSPLEFSLNNPVRAERPATMEELGQSYGFTLYRTGVTGPARGKLDLGHVRDRAIVMLDGKRVGVIDRRLNQHEITLDVPAGEHRLDLLVENLARVNFGRDMIPESKGLVEPVKFAGKELTGWDQFTLPCDDVSRLGFIAPGSLKIFERLEKPVFLRGSFTPASDADTYLDMSKWGKGVVWVNGHNLGRFWNIGPQQALYLPGCRLKPGEKNELVVLALEGDTPASISGVTGQIWETRVDPALLLRKPGQHLALAAGDAVHAGKFAPGEAWQTVKFAKPARGRHLALEALNALDGKPFAAMTEIVFLDATGHDIPREECSVVYADSEELVKENGSAALVLDNQPTTWWHTAWVGKINPGFPHTIVFDLGADREVSGFRYQPRQGSVSGRIGDYKVYLRDRPFAGL